MSDNVTLPLDSACFTFEKGVPMLEGDVDEVVQLAGYTGNLYYFADYVAYGFPVVLETHPLRPRFFWLFPTLWEPGNGWMCGIPWVRQQPYVARMTTAEFVVSGMHRVFEAKLESDPAFEQAPLHKRIAWLVSQFQQSTGAGRLILKSIEPVYDTKPESEDDEDALPSLVQQVALFCDDSRMSMNANGYTVVLDDQCHVRVPSKTVANTHEVRQVQLQQPSLTLNAWIQ